MIRWLVQPKTLEVLKYVECYWYLEKSAGGIEHPKLNPDPSAHLIISSQNQAYQYVIKDEVYKGKGSHWLYPYSHTIKLDHAKSFACIGIKFKVGALYSLNDIPFTKALLNTVNTINLESFKTADHNCEDELLATAKRSPDKCIKILDTMLHSLLVNCYEDKHSEMTSKILPLLTDAPINKLGDMLFCSQRTLERSFLKVTGFTLKQCQSMNKLEAILEYLHQRKQCDIDWVDIAYQFGFSDQPHLIRYLKQHINLTPQNYTEQRGFTIDVYGGVEPR
ncbi:helix-turn-helix domain-containing protein [bacterium]|nr:helix-turn-helix domain-containing protein [bacterium]